MESPPAPRTNATRRWGSRSPWGLLAMGVLVGLIEAKLDDHRDRWATPTASGFDWALRSATAAAPTADVVCLGDSVLKFGFAPRVFERATGRRADNWATVGNPPAVALSLLRAHLRSRGKPRAILVDFKPLLLDQEGCPALDAWARIATWGDALELAADARDPGFAAGFTLARVFPSWRDRAGIRGWIRGAVAGQPEPNAEASATRRRNWSVNHGAQLLAPDPRASTVPEHSNEPPNLRGDWACRPTNATVIGRFFALAAEHGIPVYWVLTPIHPRLQAGRDALGIDSRFTRFVRDQAERAPGRVTVIDGRRLGLGPDQFVDATHLDAHGATAFTAALGLWFANRSSGADGARWVQLAPGPLVVANALGAGLEDMDASARIVRGEAEAAKRLTLARPPRVK